MFIKAHPEQEAPVQNAITAQLSGPVQIYVRRMLELRKSGENPSPSRPDQTASPVRPQSLSPKPLPRKSYAPRPSSVAVDKAAPIDDQLAHFKNIFARASHSHEGSPNANGTGEPLSEIMRQISGPDVD